MLVLILLLIIVAAYVKMALPNVGPAPDITVDKSEASIARGKYLATSVMVCMDCHSMRDVNEFSMPMDPATLGSGGQRFDENEGFPGLFFRQYYPGRYRVVDGRRNIPGHHHGCQKERETHFPVMPYHNYGQADPADIKAVIAYLRSIPAIEHKVPESHSKFPMNFIVNTIPQKAVPGKIPVNPQDSIARGKYLFTIAACHDCHTPLEKGKFDESLSMAGGREFKMPGAFFTQPILLPTNKRVSATGQERCS